MRLTLNQCILVVKSLQWPSLTFCVKIVVCMCHTNVRLALNQCILVFKKPSVAQPHILAQGYGLYVSKECEAGLESVHIGVQKAFSDPASHSKSSA